MDIILYFKNNTGFLDELKLRNCLNYLKLQFREEEYANIKVALQFLQKVTKQKGFNDAFRIVAFEVFFK